MKVIQCKSINGMYTEGVVWEGERPKEAIGQVKHQFKSEMELMIKHDIFGDDFNLDDVNHTVEVFTDGVLWYSVNWRIEE